MKKADDYFYQQLGFHIADLAINLEIYGQKVEPSLHRYIFDICEDWDALKTYITSPIELLLGAGLLFASDGYCNLKLAGEGGDIGGGEWVSFLSSQHPIGKYKADFIVWCHSGQFTKGIVIECDGHDFHEKTKEQAQHDKSRDRFFVSKGFTVLRFTGSEIFRDTSGCIEEIEQIVQTKMHDVLVADGKINGRCNKNG